MFTRENNKLFTRADRYLVNIIVLVKLVFKALLSRAIRVGIIL